MVHVPHVNMTLSQILPGGRLDKYPLIKTLLQKVKMASSPNTNNTYKRDQHLTLDIFIHVGKWRSKQSIGLEENYFEIICIRLKYLKPYNCEQFFVLDKNIWNL